MLTFIKVDGYIIGIVQYGQPLSQLFGALRLQKQTALVTTEED